MEQIPEPKLCPLGEFNIDQNKVVWSTNLVNLHNMRFNRIAPAANMRRVTPPHEKEHGERFVPWFAPDNELARAVTLRKAAYYANPEQVLNTGDNDPGVRDATQQLLELQADYLSDHYPDLYSLDDDVVMNKATGDAYSIIPGESDLHPLAISGLLGQEDICIVEEMADGRHIMVGGFLASPTGWHLTDFVGMDMDGIHAEVVGYKEKLKETVDKSLTTLPEYPIRQFARNNSFLGMNPHLALVPEEMPTLDPETITDPAKQLLIRSEYETLTRLPATERFPSNNKYIVFTIEPRAYKLETVKRERGDEVADVIQTNAVLGRVAKAAATAIRFLKVK